MTRVTVATAAVKAALDELGEVLQPLPLPSRGWEADRAVLHQVWTRLNGCLHDATALIKNPHPGQGLETVWLRAVCRAVGDIETEIQRWHYGWDDVLRRGDSDLRWLVYDLPYAGEKLISGTYEGKGDVSLLLEPEQPALVRLHGLAEVWKTRFQNAPNEPKGFVLESINQRWKPWQKMRDRYVQQAGQLILQAVDALEISSKLFGDRTFSRCVIHSIDSPAHLPSEMMKENMSGEGLLALVERLAPTTDRDGQTQEEDATVRLTTTDGSGATNENMGSADPKESYPDPDNYARDQWIYESIQKHSCRALSLALSNKAKIEKWEIITSRNGFKKAARKYAQYHGLPERVFRKTSVTE